MLEVFLIVGFVSQQVNDVLDKNLEDNSKIRTNGLNKLYYIVILMVCTLEACQEHHPAHGISYGFIAFTPSVYPVPRHQNSFHLTPNI